MKGMDGCRLATQKVQLGGKIRYGNEGAVTKGEGWAGRLGYLASREVRSCGAGGRSLRNASKVSDTVLGRWGGCTSCRLAGRVDCCGHLSAERANWGN